MSIAHPALAGTAPLVRFALRRDRLRLPLWIALGAGLVAAQSASSQTLYSAPGALLGYQASVGSNAAAIAFSGPPVGLSTVPGTVAFEISASVMLAAALMAMFTTGRHTRADEEAGRTELVRSAHVGRHAPLFAAVIVSSRGLRRDHPRDRPGGHPRPTCPRGARSCSAPRSAPAGWSSPASPRWPRS